MPKHVSCPTYWRQVHDLAGLEDFACVNGGMVTITTWLPCRIVTSIRGTINAVNVIIKIAVCKVVDIVFNTLALAVGENTQQRLSRNRVAFLIRG